MEIKKVTDAAFKKYGRVIEGIDFAELTAKLKETPLPDEVIYEPSVAELEALPVFEELKTKTFGELPMQIGYCNGKNYYLNALEYHRCSEVNVGGTDAILLVGMQQDIEDDGTYDTANVEAFFLPEGTAVELYATTLHYAPVRVFESGYKSVVVLPKGTNYDIEKSELDPTLWGTNKWLIAHEEANIEGAFVGLIGENIEI